jgi:hypothetical protein
MLNLASIPMLRAEDVVAINKAVSKCLNVVHSFSNDPDNGVFFKKFDAYFNPVTGAVENNADYMEDQAALFQFNKCMAQNGPPL